MHGAAGPPAPAGSAAIACDRRSAASGPAQVGHRAGRPAGRAGQRRQVARGAAPGRAPGPERSASRAVRQASWGSRAVRAAASRAELGVVAGRADQRRGRAHRRPRAAISAGPAACRGAAAPRRSGVAADQQRPRPSRCARRREHLADVRVGRARLGVQVVAVVPDADQAEVATGANVRRPGADDAPAPAPRLTRQEPAVALGRPEVGRQRDVVGPAPQTSVSAASTRATSRASGTTTSAPRPAASAARRPSATATGQPRPAAPSTPRAGPARRRAPGGRPRPAG